MRNHWAALWLEGTEEVQAKVYSLQWPMPQQKAFGRCFLTLSSYSEQWTWRGKMELWPQVYCLLWSNHASLLGKMGCIALEFPSLCSPSVILPTGWRPLEGRNHISSYLSMCWWLFGIYCTKPHKDVGHLCSTYYRPSAQHILGAL